MTDESATIEPVTGEAATGEAASSAAASGESATGEATSSAAATDRQVVHRAAAAVVTAVSRDDKHGFSKPNVPAIRLLAGLGVEGDTHLGVTVQHRSRVAADPTQPNLRQVHLMHDEFHEELHEAGYQVAPGALGENVTTRGLDLLGLPRGARLRLGAEAEVEITGLRNPCPQINDYRPGLLKLCVGRDADGEVVRKAGIMGIVLRGGEVRPGDPISVELPDGPHLPLERV